MQLLAKVAFPAILVLLAAAFAFWHTREYRSALAGSPRPDEREYIRRRFRRRMRVASIICLLSLGVLFGQFIDQKQQPSVFVWYWCGLMVAVLSLLIFAMYDYVDARKNLLEQQKKDLNETSNLVRAARAEQKRIQAASNGHGQSKNIPGRPPRLGPNPLGEKPFPTPPEADQGETKP